MTITLPVGPLLIALVVLVAVALLARQVALGAFRRGFEAGRVAQHRASLAARHPAPPAGQPSGASAQTAALNAMHAVSVNDPRVKFGLEQSPSVVPVSGHDYNATPAGERAALKAKYDARRRARIGGGAGASERFAEETPDVGYGVGTKESIQFGTPRSEWVPPPLIENPVLSDVTWRTAPEWAQYFAAQYPRSFHAHGVWEAEASRRGFTYLNAHQWRLTKADWLAIFPLPGGAPHPPGWKHKVTSTIYTSVYDDPTNPGAKRLYHGAPSIFMAGRFRDTARSRARTPVYARVGPRGKRVRLR
jgi:hypothetical protein